VEEYDLHYTSTVYLHCEVFQLSFILISDHATMNKNATLVLQLSFILISDQVTINKNATL